METNFLSSWSNILFLLLKILLFLFTETWRSNFWKITLFLLVETHLRASGNHFFPPFWGTPAAASFIFWSSRKVFLNAFRLVKTDFLPSGNHFLSIFRHFCQWQFFFSSSGNSFLKRILHSVLWKLIFWLVETILFQSLKYPLIILLIPYYSKWQWIFCLMETVFFHSHFFETIIAIRERPIFFKKSDLCLRKLFSSSFFSDTDSNGSSFPVQWNRISSGNSFSSVWKRTFYRNLHSG